MSSQNKKLIVILGPTAVGKTSLSVQLAKKLNTEIISADSRQFYQKMDIGTAKANPDEMLGVPHHFINNKLLTEEYNASKFEEEVLELLEKKFKEHQQMIMVGGSGLYIQAICSGFDPEIPTANQEIRNELEELYKKEGIAALQELLKELDEEFYAQMDTQNKNRLIRAIEVCKLSGRKYSALRKGKGKRRTFDCLKIGLELPRQDLYERINQRVDRMLMDGLEKEARSLLEFQEKNALKTVGYQEFFEYFAGRTSKEKAIEKIKTNSRRYAKRQLSWFKRDEEITWFSPDDLDKIITFIHSKAKDGK